MSVDVCSQTMIPGSRSSVSQGSQRFIKAAFQVNCGEDVRLDVSDRGTGPDAEGGVVVRQTGASGAVLFVAAG